MDKKTYQYDYRFPSVIAEYSEKHDYWILLRGRETFYDEDNRLMTWKDKQEAFNWIKENHPEYQIIDLEEEI